MDLTTGRKRDGRCQEGAQLWPAIRSWTTSDVHKYVCDLGYQRYAHCFQENVINGKDLEHFNAFDLQRIGVTNMVDAMRLSEHIKKTSTKLLKSAGGPPNVSYQCGLQPFILPNGRAKLPPLPALETLRLPYRDRGDKMYRYRLAGPSYHGHCMVMGRVDVWKMYNSEF